MYEKAEITRVELNGSQCMCCRLIGDIVRLMAQTDTTRLTVLQQDSAPAGQCSSRSVTARITEVPMYEKAEITRVELNSSQCMCCRLVGQLVALMQQETQNHRSWQCSGRSVTAQESRRFQCTRRLQLPVSSLLVASACAAVWLAPASSWPSNFNHWG